MQPSMGIRRGRPACLARAQTSQHAGVDRSIYGPAAAAAAVEEAAALRRYEPNANITVLD